MERNSYTVNITQQLDFSFLVLFLIILFHDEIEIEDCPN